jgi:hypothetical protein
MPASGPRSQIGRRPGGHSRALDCRRTGETTWDGEPGITLRAGNPSATFLPDVGMTGVPLDLRGQERLAVPGGVAVLLLRDAARGARILAVGAVASVVIGWGVAQWPCILPETLEVADAAAPSATLTTLVVAAAGALFIVVPGSVLLYTLQQRGLLAAEGVD